jgi:hypothetical protein
MGITALQGDLIGWSAVSGFGLCGKIRVRAFDICRQRKYPWMSVNAVDRGFIPVRLRSSRKTSRLGLAGD